ncbi:type II toxin-antitoxin system PemK/MazF family toxin [Pseudomonas cichorii]|nr:type II toxin-antitoxin system PemK/MazF family toxin [Pseudomonas cichorii]MBX8572920.1 type II toxin-antitoxin system PemK/MazF family toxin [Pseudomonas cichorii]MBX8588379.1 type II toxin-antitoxin system PemK/MazF family toxin [Pseudomonas cichorii]MBX8605512.1 type II toxin-antitoxin system PemK/MazF family toxin [Pseudomonas cichorii]
MPLQYQPKEGTIVMCDFRGLEAPEMIKTRPVVVMRRSSHNSALVIVVPLSTTRPHAVLDHHIQFESLIPGPQTLCWAKCDMIYTVALARLDRIKVKNRHTGKREYLAIPLPEELFTAIQVGVRSALGL